MVEFLKGLLWLGAIILQVYISEFTELKNYYCFLLTIPLSILIGIVFGGVSKGALFGRDERGVPTISVTFGVYLFMQLILVVFTFIALGER